MRIRRVVVVMRVLLCVAIVLAWLVWIHRQGQPVPVPAANAVMLPCVSYAPFRRDGHTPFDATLVVTPAQIEEDLRILAKVTRCVRSYGVDRGAEALPAVAQRLGMRVVLGAWIGRDPAANAQQIDLALQLAAAYRDTVAMIVIGNEVLLRRELDAESLARLLADARQRSPVPVAYADVWEFWLRHGAALRDHVDVVAVHVLPYWEDEPVHVHDAVVHVRTTVERVQRAFEGKPVWLAESGWPAAGRQRGPAAPGTVQQTSFVRGLLDDAALHAAAAGLPAGIGAMNLIEAFDQPWKRALEGAVGGHWGLFDATGQRRATLQGDVVPRPDATRALLLAAIGAVAGALLGARSVAGRFTAMAIATSAGAGLMAAASWQWQLLADGSVDARAWAFGVAWGVITLACGLLAAQCVAKGNDGSARARNAMARVHLAWLAVTAVFALQLVFDARYRDVSWPLPAAAAACLLLWRACGQRPAGGTRHERALAALLALCAPLILWQEGLANAQAWSAVFTCTAAAAATWWPHRGDLGDRGITSRHVADTHASNANTAPGADQPAP